MQKNRNLIILIFFITFLLLPKRDSYFIKFSSSINEEFENEMKKYLCKIINSETEKCFDIIFNNFNFFNELKIIQENISLLIYLNKTNIENILLLMGIFPFLKNNSISYFTIKKRKTFNILKNIFEYKSFTKNSFNMNETDFNKTKNKIINSLNYKWELIPSQKIINIIRYTLNNYYEESFLELFDKFLNLNYKYYLNSHFLSVDTQRYLMSKSYKQI